MFYFRIRTKTNHAQVKRDLLYNSQPCKQSGMRNVGLTFFSSFSPPSPPPTPFFLFLAIELRLISTQATASEPCFGFFKKADILLRCLRQQ